MIKRIGKTVLCLALCLVLLASVRAAAAGSAYPDIENHWARERMAQAVSDGLLSGFEDGSLRPDATITQAQILTILCRALGMEPVSAPDALGLTGGEWYADAALSAYDRGLISDASRLREPMARGGAMILLCRTLGLTDAEPDPALLEPFSETAAAPEVLSLVRRGIVEGVGGSLRLDRAVSRAEFVTVLYRALGPTDAVARGTAELRDIGNGGTLWCGADCTELTLHGVRAEELIVCAGEPKTITLEAGSEIGRVRLLCGGSPRLRVTGDSRLSELSAEGDGCALEMTGRAEKLYVRAGDFTLSDWSCAGEVALCSTRSEIPWWVGYRDERDYGITGTKFTVTATEKLAVNDFLRASAALTLPPGALGKTVTARWYLGDRLLKEGMVRLTESGQKLSLTSLLEYSRDLPKLSSVRLELEYAGADGTQTLSAESPPVAIDNWSEEYYLQLERERVLALVDTGYDGDYTVEWAQKHDYSAGDKTLWVNAKGYESDTEYLIWVSVKYQRCNIFRGSAGAWTLARSGIVGTGAEWSATPVGVWKTTYKQELGWTTATYTVRPVVRFKGGGYAFHSRLYAPNSNYLTEPDVGYPMSHGCVRMLDEDIWWIFENIPENTTVVVF